MQRPNVRFKSKAHLKRPLAEFADRLEFACAIARKSGGHVAVKGTKRPVAFAARRNALRLLRPTG
jgi:hypothetical protein